MTTPARPLATCPQLDCVALCDTTCVAAVRNEGIEPVGDPWRGPSQVDVDNAWNRGYERGVAEGLKRAATAVRAQAGLPDLVHFDRPSDFRKGVLTCLAALESLAGKTAEEAPGA